MDYVGESGNLERLSASVCAHGKMLAVYNERKPFARITHKVVAFVKDFSICRENSNKNFIPKFMRILKLKV